MVIVTLIGEVTWMIENIHLYVILALVIDSSHGVQRSKQLLLFHLLKQSILRSQVLVPKHYG